MHVKRTIQGDIRNDQVLATRFWIKVDRREPDECWNWTAYRAQGRYGKFGINGRVHFAHRVAWELTNGPIPNGMLVLHRCDNEACCNPGHLFLGTQNDNMADMWSKRRHTPLNGASISTFIKLTEDDVRRIRELRSAGMYQRVIAEQFGITQSNVAQILRGKTWKNV